MIFTLFNNLCDSKHLEKPVEQFAEPVQVQNVHHKIHEKSNVNPLVHMLFVQGPETCRSVHHVYLELAKNNVIIIAHSQKEKCNDHH